MVDPGIVNLTEGAVSGNRQTWQEIQTVTLDDKVRFDAAFANGGVQPTENMMNDVAVNSPLQTEGIPPPTQALGDRILQGMVGMDSTFQKIKPMLQDMVNKSDVKTAVGFEDIYKMHVNAMQISMWSAGVNLATAEVSKSTKGVETLFRSGGA